MARLYRYQGPRAIADAVASHTEGHRIRSAADLEHWMHHTAQQANSWGLIEATFVIDRDGVLSLADRHSEHVACAGGKAVRAAGEMFFARYENGWEIREVSNQSTGYCPEPSSWQEVAAALARIPLAGPEGFSQVYLFRRCPACRQINLIKEQVFVCAVCDSEPPRAWNFDGDEAAGSAG
jgi:hypothetical protein